MNDTSSKTDIAYLEQSKVLRQKLQDNRQLIAYSMIHDEDVFPRSIAMRFILKQKIADMSLLNQFSDYLSSHNKTSLWSKHTFKLLLLGVLKYSSYSVSQGLGRK
jgi:hypothetical protein